jgi:hypothetical protein
MTDDRPTTPELVDALSEYLRDEVQPGLQGTAAYEARIAQNLVAIVKRELELGQKNRRLERQRLIGLFGHEAELDELNAELCRKIRSRELTVRDSALLDHLRQSTLDRLAIDNPRYSAYLRAQSDHKVRAR